MGKFTFKLCKKMSIFFQNFSLYLSLLQQEFPLFYEMNEEEMLLEYFQKI